MKYKFILLCCIVLSSINMAVHSQTSPLKYVGNDGHPYYLLQNTIITNANNLTDYLPSHLIKIGRAVNLNYPMGDVLIKKNISYHLIGRDVRFYEGFKSEVGSRLQVSHDHDIPVGNASLRSWIPDADLLSLEYDPAKERVLCCADSIRSNVGLPMTYVSKLVMGDGNTSTEIKGTTFNAVYDEYLWDMFHELQLGGSMRLLSDHRMKIDKNLDLECILGFYMSPDYFTYSSKEFETLSVDGNIQATGYTKASDRRFKSNIKDISNARNLLKIQGVSYNPIDFETKKPKPDNKIGVIAQNVKALFPEVVSGSDALAVKYDELIPILIETVKSQSKQIQANQAKLDKLRGMQL